MTQVVKFSGQTDFESIGHDGFIETAGVEITLVGATAGNSFTQINPVDPSGYSNPRCRLVLETAAIPQIIAALAQVMVDQMASQKTRELLEARPDDGGREVVEQISPHDLEMMFGPKGSCPDFTRDYWLYEIKNGDTETGYWEWVSDRLYNETLERTMNIDHAAEMLLVMRAEIAKEAFEALDWSEYKASPVERGHWFTEEFDTHDELRCSVSMTVGRERCFYAEFDTGTTKFRYADSFAQY